MRRGGGTFLRLACLAALCAPAAMGGAALADSTNRWSGYADIVVRPASRNSSAGFEFFVPVVQGQDSLVFIDANLNTTDDAELYGNFGGGVRKIISSNVILGGLAFFDHTQSKFGKTFYGATVGGELLTQTFDARVNFHVPVHRRQTLADMAGPTVSSLALSGHELVQTTATQLLRIEDTAYTGIDAELGARLPLPLPPLHELRVFAGGYHYWNGGGPDFSGATGRFEFRANDVFGSWLPEARLILGAGASYDHVRQGQVFGEARLRIPFGKTKDLALPPLSPLEKRMTEHVRGSAIVTEKKVVAAGAKTTRSVTTDPTTGLPYNNIWFADGENTIGAGTQEDPTTLNDAVSRAGASGIVIAEGNAGTITTPGVTLFDRQRLLGGGTVVPVLLSNGSIVGFALGALPGIIQGVTASNVITLANDNTIRNITTTGGTSGIFGSGIAGGLLDNVSVRNTTGAGIVLNNIADTFRIFGGEINGTGGAGISASNVASLLVAGTTFGNTAAIGGTALQVANTTGANLLALGFLNVANAGGAGISVDGAAGGSTTVTAFFENTMARAGAGGVLFNGVTFDADPSAPGVQGVGGGNLTIGDPAAPGNVHGDGFRLNSVAGILAFGTLGIANDGGTGLFIRNAPAGFIFANAGGSVTTTHGTAIDLDPVTVFSTFQSVTASGGVNGILLNDVSGSFTVGTTTISNTSGAGIDIRNSSGTFGFGVTTVSDTADDGISLTSNPGTVTFGATTISNPGVAGIDIEGSNGPITFGDVNIVNLGSGRGVDLRDGATPTQAQVIFNSLNISGTGAAGSRGIDYSGTTNSFNVGTLQSGTITGVDIGVDLTNASTTGIFRYGDGSDTDANGAGSTISANRPLEIAGLDTTHGTYDFRDVNLVGNTSNLSNASMIYFVDNAVDGIDNGTAQHPGTLAGAEASGRPYIILVNNGTVGSPTTIDAASPLQGNAGGNNTLDLIADQQLLSFRNSETLDVPGATPPNLLLHGVNTGQVTNPNPGSGAPILTTTFPLANTVTLASGNRLEGVRVTNNGGGASVSGSGINNLTVVGSELAGVSLINATGTAALTDTTLTSLTLSGGSVNVTGSNADITNNANVATIAVSGGHTGTVTFDANSAILASNGTGLQFNNAAGSYTFNGPTTLNGGDAGVDILSSAGTFAFSSNTTITSPTGTAFNVNGGTAGVTYSGNITQANNAAAVSVTDHATGTVTFQTGTIDATGGPGLQFSNAAGNYNFNGTTNLHGGDAGVDILSSAGTFAFSSNTTITSPTGTAFNVNGGTAGVTYSGNITQANNAAAVSVTDHATGTVTFQTGTIDATGGPGLQFNNADGTYAFNGTTNLHGGDAGIDIVNGSAGAFTFGANTSITSPTGTAFNLDSSTAGVTYSGNVTQANNAAAVSITNHSGGTVTFQTGTIDATNGTGLQFSNAAGNYNFNSTTNLHGGDAGVDILSSAGTFAFGSSTTITSPTGAAFNINGGTANVTYIGNITQANNAAAVSVTDHATGTVTFQTGAIDATGGTGLQFNNADGTYAFIGTTNLHGGDAGIDIVNGSAGAFTFGANTSITSPTGTAFNLDSSTAGVTYNGTITQNNAASAVAINALTGGFVTFGGNVTASTGTGTAVNLTNNTGGTINFNGGLGITTTTGIGFNATGGGTVNVAATAGTESITNSAGQAVAINGVTINITFDSIASTGTGGATTGIALQNLLTGSSFTVSGTTTVDNHGTQAILVDGSGGFGNNVTVSFGTTNINRTTPVAGAAGIVVSGIAGQNANINFGAVGIGVPGPTMGNAVRVQNITGTGFALNVGSLDIANVATGVSVDNLDAGTMTVTGTTTVLGTTGNAINIANSSGAVTFGATTINNAGADGVALSANSGAMTFSATTINSPVGSGVSIAGESGPTTFSSLNITNPGTNGIVATGTITGAVNLGAVTIALQTNNTTGVNLSGATVNANITASDFDLTSTTATGTTGVNLVDTTGTGTVRLGDTNVAGNSSTISGVNTGALFSSTTNLSFIFGDAEGTTDVGSSISAVTPIADNGTGLPTSGTYNFLDVNLIGDTSNLSVGSVYYVNAAGTGDGSRNNPGNLTGAEASGADFIVLVDTQAGAPADTIDAFSAAQGFAGGNNTLNLAVNQRLLSFLTGDSVTVGGGAPASFLLTGITTGTITNPNPGTGAPILTTTALATDTVTLASGNRLDGVDVRNGGGANALAGTGIADLTVVGSALTGVSLTNATGTASFTNTTLTSLTLSGGTVNVTGTNADITNNAGATISVSGGHTGTVSFDANSTLAVTGGTGLQFSNADGSYTFNGTNTLNGGDAGIDILAGSGGTFTFSSNTAITSPTGTAFNVDASSATVNYNGTITQNNAASAVSITNNTGGIVTFGGLVTANTSTATAVNLTSNTGATINFNSGLAINTSTGTGFNATGGGTVSVLATAGTESVTTTAGQAINLSGITAGIAFDSVSSTGAATGIGLDNVSGTFTVSGATNITNASIAGISIANSSANANFNGTTTVTNNVGFNGNGVDLGVGAGGANTGTYSFAGVDITVNGAGAFGFRAQTSGTVNITDPNGTNQITSNNGTALFVNPTIINMALTSITAANGANGISLSGASGSLTVTGTVNVSNTTGAGIDIQGSTSAFTANFQGATTINNSAAVGGGVNLVGNTAGTVNFSGGLNIDTTTGVGFNATGGGTVNVSATGGDESIVAANGQALQLNGIQIGASGMNFDSLASTNGGGININNVTQSAAAGFVVGSGGTTLTDTTDTGLIIANSSATFNFGGTTDITGAGTNATHRGIFLNGANGAVTFNSIDIDGATGVGFLVVGNTNTITVSGGSVGGTTTNNGGFHAITSGTGDINFGAAITNTTNNAVLISNRTGGTITFSNLVTANTGATTAISLAGNTGATINFTGGLNVDTTTATAFSVTGGGTVNVTGSGNTIDSGSGTTFLNDGTGGSATIAINAALTGTAGRLVDIQNRAQANTVTLSGDLSNTGAGASGILVQNNSAGSTTFSGTTKTISVAGANSALTVVNSAGHVVVFSGNSTTLAASGSGNTVDVSNGATLNFGSSTTNAINATGTGIAFQADGGGTVTVTGSGTVSSSGTGIAVDIENTAIGAGGVTFASVSKSIAGATGIQFTNVTGGAFVANGGSIANTTTRGVDISGGTANFTYAGTINNASATGRSVEVTGRTGGTATFTGGITDTGQGINLQTNTGSTNTFTGGLNLTTGTNTAFNATGGGTVNVTGTTNTITTSTGTAVNIATDIGASGVTFRSINVNGATNGIVLNTTGSTGFFTVTGTGAANSGGTIQNTTGSGVLLTSAQNISLTDMTIANTGSHGIEGTTVTNLDLTRLTITSPGDATNENGITITDLLGTSAAGKDSVFNQLTITGSSDNGIEINNTTSTNPGNATASFQDRLSVFASSISTSATTGILATTQGTANFYLNVDGAGTANTFTNNSATGISLNANGGILRGTVNANTITGSFRGIDGGSTGASTASQLLFDITGNTISQAGSAGTGPAGIAFAAFTGGGGNGTIVGTISNNIIGTSQSTVGILGISLVNQGNGQNTFNIANNTITLPAPPVGAGNSDGIFVTARQGSGRTDVTINSNNITNASPDLAVFGIDVYSGNGTVGEASRVCANITNNTVSLPGQPTYFGIVVGVNIGDTFQIQGLTPAAGASVAQVQAYLAAQNPASQNGGGVDTSTGNTTYTAGTCATP